jgi:hypothetical protein
MKTMLEKMIQEKGIDKEAELEIEGNIGITVEMVLGFIYKMPAELQKKVARKFIEIDFNNGDIMNFIKYLGEGMAKGF